MPEQVLPLSQIEAEAKAAAHRYSDVASACPYPFHTDAAHAFKAYFLAARAALAQPQPSTHS